MSNKITNKELIDFAKIINSAMIKMETRLRGEINEVKESKKQPNQVLSDISDKGVREVVIVMKNGRVVRIA